MYVRYYGTRLKSKKVEDRRDRNESREACTGHAANVHGASAVESYLAHGCSQRKGSASEHDDEVDLSASRSKGERGPGGDSPSKRHRSVESSQWSAWPSLMRRSKEARLLRMEERAQLWSVSGGPKVSALFSLAQPASISSSSSVPLVCLSSAHSPSRTPVHPCTRGSSSTELPLVEKLAASFPQQRPHGSMDTRHDSLHRSDDATGCPRRPGRRQYRPLRALPRSLHRRTLRKLPRADQGRQAQVTLALRTARTRPPRSLPLTLSTTCELATTQ